MKENSEIDPYQKAVLEHVLNGESLFVSGKAGTGKSYLLKNYIVPALAEKGIDPALVAPTGIAAENIKGVTIHFFFRMPTAPYLPGNKNLNLYNQTATQIKTIKSLKVLIIDEISMVRCDMLDAIDDILRYYKQNEEPFGGVQVVLFGDLFQLMPVATESDTELLRRKYKPEVKATAKTHDCFFFFNSYVYKKKPLPMIELMKNHRQGEDKYFAEMLNRVRIGNVNENLLNEFNKCLYHSVDKEHSIRLCSLNKTAWGYNKGRLEELGKEIVEFYGSSEGDVYREDLPTDRILQLAVGAYVMVVRNDNENKQYINGTRGRIIRLIGKRSIDIKTDDNRIITVSRCKWYFYRYFINPVTKRMEQQVRGTFEQMPLKLAWAITVHKSQGLTLDNMVLDASRTFADGQLYVALSRAHNFHKLQFVTKLVMSYVKTNSDVHSFMKNVEKIDVEIDESYKAKKAQHPKGVHVNEKIYSMAAAGMSIDEMVSSSGQRKELVYSDLSRLVESGRLNPQSFMSHKAYKNIKFAISKLGCEAPLVDIKKLCRDALYGEIGLVLSEFKYKSFIGKNPVDIDSKGDDVKIPVISKVTKTVSEKVSTNKAKEGKSASAQSKPLVEKVKSQAESIAKFIRIPISDESMNGLRRMDNPIYKQGIVNRQIAESICCNPEYFDRTFFLKCPLVPKKLRTIYLVCKSGRQYKADVNKITFSLAQGVRKQFWVAQYHLSNITKA